jgi:RNA polymerase sigma-70 factor (sigma-E family)
MARRSSARGDGETEFDAFVAARTPALTRTAYLLTGDSHLAEDLVQTALFKAALRWRSIHGSPEAYVRRAMYHENISWWRRRRHLTEQALGDHDRAAPVHDDDARIALRDALALLTARQRTVLVLRYFEDLTERQTAEAMGVGVGTVKSMHRQALDRLRSRAPHLAELVESPA